jgi:hypothetical protein
MAQYLDIWAVRAIGSPRAFDDDVAVGIRFASSPTFDAQRSLDAKRRRGGNAASNWGKVTCSLCLRSIHFRRG